MSEYLSAEQAWRKPAGRYVVLLAAPHLLVAIVFAAVTPFVAQEPSPLPFPLWPLFPAAAAGFVLSAVASVLRTRTLGYRLREDDLLVRQGLLWRREISAPYGRMQHIDVQQDALARLARLADLRLSTAAVVPVRVRGLPREEARELRDRLAAHAASRRAGL